jgi:hypothetical protein
MSVSDKSVSPNNAISESNPVMGFITTDILSNNFARSLFI